MLLSIGASAPAWSYDDPEYELPSNSVCFRASSKVDDYVCYDDGEDALTLAEEIQIARIISIAQKRAELQFERDVAEYKKERAIEDARLQRCTGLLLWKKSPPRTLEAERYWAKK